MSINNTKQIIIDRVIIKNRRIYTQYSKHISKGNYMTYSNAKPIHKNTNTNIKLNIEHA
jgi:hypothetical protein